MFFVVLDYYCKTVLEIRPEELLGIDRSGWFRYKKDNTLPLKHCKTICSHFNHHITDDMNELLIIATSKYVEVM